MYMYACINIIVHKLTHSKQVVDLLVTDYHVFINSGTPRSSFNVKYSSNMTPYYTLWFASEVCDL